MWGLSPAFVACWGPRRGRPRRWRGPPGSRLQPLAHPPRSPLRLRLPSATPRVGGVPGAAVAGAAVSALRASGAPSRGGAAGLAVLVAGVVTSAGSGSWVDGPVSAEAARGCPAGGPAGTAASASLRSSRLRGGLPRPFRGDGGAGAGPAVVAVVPLGGAIKVRHHCYPGRHAWWQVRPSHYLPVHQCHAVGSAVQCSAGWNGGGGGGRLWRQPRTDGGRWPSIGIGRGGGGATQPTRRATAPSLGQGSGPWAPWGSSGGAGASRTRT